MTKESIITDLLVPVDERQLLKKEANHFLSWQLTDRQICDLELLLSGFIGIHVNTSLEKCEERDII